LHTLELLREVDIKITRVAERMDAQSDAHRDRNEAIDKRHDDHEARIRLAESSITSIIAARTQSASIWPFVWAGAIQVIGILLQGIELYAFIAHSDHSVLP
jgi:hypothetical protein